MKPKIDETSFLFLRAKVEDMSMPEKLHRLAQLTDFEEWILYAQDWLSEAALNEDKKKICS